MGSGAQKKKENTYLGKIVSNDIAPPITRILHVEDNVIDAFLIRNLLSNLCDRKNYFIERVESIGAAIDVLTAFHHNSYGAILLDLSVMDASELEGLERLKKLGVTTPIIIVTGYGDEDLQRRAQIMGASRYITKRDLHHDPAMLDTALAEALA